MLNVAKESLELLAFHNLSEFNYITHCITTRKGGFSKNLYESLNLSLNVGDNIGDVLKNREIVNSFFESDKSRIFIPSQCHTKNVKVISEGSKIEDLAETDALITNVKGQILAVMAADCVPILLFDPIKKAIAAIHAGWKGTVLNIVSSTIQEMVKKYQTNPKDLIAGIGPCISAESYEVGAEVASEFINLFGNNTSIIKAGKLPDKSNIDLSEANKLLLIQQGVKAENIEVSGICTYNNTGLFFSARRDGSKCGRFSSAIMLNN